MCLLAVTKVFAVLRLVGVGRVGAHGVRCIAWLEMYGAVCSTKQCRCESRAVCKEEKRYLLQTAPTFAESAQQSRLCVYFWLVGVIALQWGHLPLTMV